MTWLRRLVIALGRGPQIPMGYYGAMKEIVKKEIQKEQIHLARRDTREMSDRFQSSATTNGKLVNNAKGAI